MKNKMFLLISSLLLLCLLTACNQDDEQVPKPDPEFEAVQSAMYESSLKLAKSEPLVEKTAFAYNGGDKNMFLLGITFQEEEAPTKEQQIKIFEKYLSEAANHKETKDWKVYLKNYNVTFEQILSNGESKVLAVKKSNTDVIEFIDE